MITDILFEKPVMVPGLFKSLDRFERADGWSIAKVGHRIYELSREARPVENIEAVEPFVVDGYAAVYVMARGNALLDFPDIGDYLAKESEPPPPKVA
jgi:hypothetical protein